MNETIGSRIAKFRKARNMTQEDLANVMGITAQAVSKWENDLSCPDISILSKLCRTLGVTTDELLEGKRDDVMLVPESQRKPLEQMIMHIKVNSSEGDKVRVNLPMPLVKVAMEIGVQVLPGMGGDTGDMLKNVDLSKIVEMVEKGLIGKLVEVESADGDTVEIVVE